jgi:hypothetical protein
MVTKADVFVDTRLSGVDENLIVEALEALGVSARVRVLPPVRGISDLQWLVLAALPLQAFLSGIGAKAADDAYRKFQDTIHKLTSRDQSPVTRPIVLQDTDTGLRIVLDHDLPADGYRQLLSLDLARFRLGPVHYDRAERRWRSETDEAAAR